MASLYPSLEDMQVDKMIQAQQTAFYQQHQQPSSAASSSPSAPPPPAGSAPQPTAPAVAAVPAAAAAAAAYPDLGDFMGLELSQQMLATNMPAFVREAYSAAPTTTSVVVAGPNNGASPGATMVAPLSGATAAILQKAHVTNGIRELVLCKGADNKVGLRVKDINKGCFVSVVVRGSPAATAGLRFGDQILQVNGTIVAGYSIEQLHTLLRKAPANGIRMAVRDRPFERSVTLHKDSHGRLGFQMDSAGRVTAIVKDSSAARNGVLTEQHVLEVNAQNVVGMSDKERLRVIAAAGPVVTVTLVPTFIYEHMVSK